MSQQKEEWEPEKLDRERGILTEADRKFLRGEKDLAKQSEVDARYRIRKRLKNGIWDLSFLDRELKQKDRSQVAKTLFSDENQYAGANIVRPLIFFFKMLYDNHGDIDDVVNRLENVIRIALNQTANEILGEEYIIRPSVEINLSYRKPEIPALLDRYESFDESFDEFHYLREHDYISPGKEYYHHLFRHLWDAGTPFTFQTPEGEFKELDPSNHETVESFVDEGMEYLSMLFNNNKNSTDK